VILEAPDLSGRRRRGDRVPVLQGVTPARIAAPGRSAAARFLTKKDGPEAVNREEEREDQRSRR
jgi:hypothetical protein